MKLIVYDSIEKKNEIEVAMARPLTPAERLTRTLDWLDLLAAFRRSPVSRNEDDGIDWIILKLKDDKSFH